MENKQSLDYVYNYVSFEFIEFKRLFSNGVFSLYSRP